MEWLDLTTPEAELLRPLPARSFHVLLETRDLLQPVLIL
jgi:hypothetical protein